MGLDEYHHKRHFDTTPEPAGATTASTGPLRFVVQKHAATRLHYDFRLEAGSTLKSWAIPKGPSTNPENKHLAVMVEDHPLEYRTFEGTIPKDNYGAGAVMVWDEGTYEPLGANGDPAHDQQLVLDGIKAGHITFILHGSKLGGEWALVKIAHADEENSWLIIKARKDEFARADDVLEHDRSAITGRTLDEIADHKPVTKLLFNLSDMPKQPLPQHPEPMLAELGGQAFDNSDWGFEIKWDGYRIISEITLDGVKLWSRRGQDYTQKFAPVASDLAMLKVPAVLDGEVVVLNDVGKGDFQMLQDYLRTGAGRLMYLAYDILHLNGHDLTGLPLSRRQEILRRVLPQGDHLKLSEAVFGQGKALFDQATRAGLEGIMAKRLDSRYQPGKRSPDWLKLKTVHRQEAVIVGWTEPRAGRQYFGSLVLAVHRDGRLSYAGHVGTGFSDTDLRELHERLQPSEIPKSPLQPEPTTNEPAHWVKPELVAEIGFTEWTDDGSMRHPSFIGLREDKLATDVVAELPVSTLPVTSAAARIAPAGAGSDETLKLNGHNIKFSHRSKVFWPDEGITKGDLLDYYLQVADTLLPYLKDRPESLNRFPGGITGESFYQKNMDGKAPSWAKTHTIHSLHAADDVEYLLAQNEATLAYMLNLGCIEFNPWSSRLGHLEKPDWAVIDLDPEAVEFEAVIKTAQAVHTVLGEFGIAGYPKTSGATGIHIYIPLRAQYTYDQAKLFAELIANLTHQRLPDITSVERLPKKRQGKVYLDFLQNRHGQTLAQAYSVRPRPGATVSTPLNWDEVKPGLLPSQFTLRNTPARLARVGDLWNPVLGPAVKLQDILAHIDSKN
jgi:bifunctional non-homologous end joining protein LigD